MIKRLLIKAYNYFLKKKRELKWLRQVRYWRKQISFKETKPIDNDARYLILAPHSDDEWIGCSRIIKTCKHVIILNMDMQGGDTKELHHTRFLEMNTLVSKYGRRLLTIGHEKEKSLAEIIADVKPDCVCLPFFFDWHPEHIQVMRYLNQALSNSSYQGKILMYQVSLPIDSVFVNVSTPMSNEELRDKWNTFKETYKTQTMIAYKRFMANERINGAISGAYAAEVYVTSDICSWLGEFEKLMLTSSEIDKVKCCLSNITKVRLVISNFAEGRNVLFPQ